MEARQLWQSLSAFGLEEAEARLYFELSHAGPQRAAELAEATGIHRTEVYRLARNLVDKGFAERTLERPVRFAPRPLEEVLALHTERAEKEVLALRAQGRQLVEQWPDRGRSWDGGSTRFVVHQGLPQVRTLIDRMLQGAQEEVVIVAPPQGLQRLGLAELEATLAMRTEDGVRVRILTRLDGEEALHLHGVAAFCEVRHVELTGYHQMVIVDSREIALFVATGRSPRQDETVLWLTAPEFVLAQKALVDHVWTGGIAHREVVEAFSDGHAPRRAEVVRGRWVALSRLKQMLYDSDTVVVQMAADEYQQWERRGLSQVVEQRLQAGADIRFLLHGSLENPPRHVRLIDDTIPLFVAATPEGHVLACRPADEGWGLQANLPELGLWVWHLLDARWNEAVLADHAITH